MTAYVVGVDASDLDGRPRGGPRRGAAGAGAAAPVPGQHRDLADATPRDSDGSATWRPPTTSPSRPPHVGTMAREDARDRSRRWPPMRRPARSASPRRPGDARPGIGLDGVDNPVDRRRRGHVPAPPRAARESDPLAGAGFAPAYSAGGAAAPATVRSWSRRPFLAHRSTSRGSGSTATPPCARRRPLRCGARWSLWPRVRGALVPHRGRCRHHPRGLPACPGRSTRSTRSRPAPVPPCWWCCCWATSLSLAAVLLAGWLRSRPRRGARAAGEMGAQPRPAGRRSARRGDAARRCRRGPGRARRGGGALPMTHLLDLRAAGLAQAPTVTASLALTVVGGAPTVVPWSRPASPPGAPRRPRPARSAWRAPRSRPRGS